MHSHSTAESFPLRLEVIISLVDASSVAQQLTHLAATDKACELSLRLTLMEYPVLAIVPPTVDIDTSPVIDFGGRGKSCDFTIKAEAVGVEPVPLWLLLVLRVGEEDQYLLATGCFDMRRYVENAVLGPPTMASFDKLTVALAPTAGAASSSSVEVSLFLRMSRISSSLPSRAAAEAVEPRPPAIVSATANVGTDPMAATEPPVGADHRSTVSTTRGQDVAAGDNDGDQRPASSVRRGRTRKKAGLSPGRLRRRLSRSVEKQLRRSTEIHRAQSRSLSRRRSKSPPLTALRELNRRGREHFGSLRRSTSEKGSRLSAPLETSAAPRLPSTAPSLHDVLAGSNEPYGTERTAPVLPHSLRGRPAPAPRRVPLAKTLSLIQELSSELAKIQKMTHPKADRDGERVTCFCCGAEVLIGKADIHAKKRCLRVLPSALSPASVDDRRKSRTSRQVWR